MIVVPIAVAVAVTIMGVLVAPAQAQPKASASSGTIGKSASASSSGGGSKGPNLVEAQRRTPAGRSLELVPGQYIVHLHDGLTADHTASLVEHVREVHASTKSKHREARGTVTKVFKRLLNAFVVRETSEAMKTLLQDHEMVKLVEPDAIAYKNDNRNPTWGLDRIDQRLLPLDDAQYDPLYNGSTVDIYIVDTGLDTNHAQFSNTNERVVQNIFNGYGSVKKNGNNDGDGHGTHVAGTAAGRTVGVSPAANLWGVKVLSDGGSGSFSTIVEGLEEVAAQAKERNASHRAVASMSLGGYCGVYMCTNLPSIGNAIEALTDAGVVVSVAAGNDDDNACYYSPASTASAITVGATDVDDELAYFSNYGECVDIQAPGVSVISACSDGTSGCDNETSYVSFSGTSMACPHVSGAAAQVLALDSGTLSNDEVIQSLQCIGVQNQVDIDSEAEDDTRNILLQIPNDTSTHLCDLGAGCTDSCSGNGFCDTSTGVAQCFCDTNYVGDTCGYKIGQSNCVPGDNSTVQVNITLFSSNATGWGTSQISVLDYETEEEKLIISMDAGAERSVFSMCVEPGLYRFEAKEIGSYWLTAGWEVCGRNGSILTETGVLNVTSSDPEDCAWSCVGSQIAVPFQFSPTGDTYDLAYATLVVNDTLAAGHKDYDDDAFRTDSDGILGLLLTSNTASQYECLRQDVCEDIYPVWCPESGIQVCGDTESVVRCAAGNFTICPGNNSCTYEEDFSDYLRTYQVDEIYIQQTPAKFTDLVDTHPNWTQSLGDEDTETFDLPWTLEVDNREFDTITVSSNGFFSFERFSDARCCAGRSMANADEYSYALWWTDLDPSAGGTIYVGETLDADDSFAIVFDRVPEWGSPLDVTTQAKIFPNGTVIVRVPFLRSPYWDSAVSVGVNMACDAYLTVLGPSSVANGGGLQWEYQVSNLNTSCDGGNGNASTDESDDESTYGPAMIALFVITGLIAGAAVGAIGIHGYQQYTAQRHNQAIEDIGFQMSHAQAAAVPPGPGPSHVSQPGAAPVEPQQVILYDKR